MKTFEDFEYARPDLESLAAGIRASLADFSAARSASAAAAAAARVHGLCDLHETAKTLVEIRHSCDTRDPRWEAENDFMDEADPVMEGLKSEISRALVASPYRRELEAAWGSQVFRLAELQLKTFSPEVLEDLKAENRLSSEYVRLKASAEIEFLGERRNLPGLAVFTESPDRATRKAATEAVSGFYAANAAEFDRIYDGLVKLRDRIARKLGFADFVPLGYARVGRGDWDAAMAASFRSQVRESLVPLASSLRARQARRLGLPSLRFHDEHLEHPDGNARLIGGAAGVAPRAERLFAELAPETRDFWAMMRDRRLLDLETRPGKAGGGFCTFIPSERVPFVFANFNGTPGDVDTFAHEMGHALQMWRSRNLYPPECRMPTLEACEIHSMSMEFLAWPWLEDFFGADAAKYRFSHLAAGILFVPYGCLVDEFQHRVYAEPSATPAERKALWRRLERDYLPSRDYGEDAFLEGGGYWFRQGHIFEDPFYYLDYCLAQASAWEFWAASRADRGGAWRRYLALCDLGGSRSYTGLLAEAGLADPFRAGTMARLAAPLSSWLEGEGGAF